MAAVIDLWLVALAVYGSSWRHFLYEWQIQRILEWVEELGTTCKRSRENTLLTALKLKEARQWQSSIPVYS